MVTKELMSRDEVPTCIFMPDDYSAIGGFNALRDMGLSVPDDVSIVGFDGISYSQLMHPKLQPTFRIPKLSERSQQKSLLN